MGARFRQLHISPRTLCAPAGYAILVSLALSCSARNNYKTLSFFFDGVPNPDAPVKTVGVGGIGAAGQTVAIKAYRHKPYAQGQCDACHVNKKQLVTLSTDLCIKCHTKTAKEYPSMHVPAAIGQCLWCHEPHESDSPRLLKTTATRLCLQCHDPALLSDSVKEHQSAEANCLSCHGGHGGTKPSLLLADNPGIGRVPLPAAPATQESSATDAPAPGGVP